MGEAVRRLFDQRNELDGIGLAGYEMVFVRSEKAEISQIFSWLGELEAGFQLIAKPAPVPGRLALPGARIVPASITW